MTAENPKDTAEIRGTAERGQDLPTLGITTKHTLSALVNKRQRDGHMLQDVLDSIKLPVSNRDYKSHHALCLGHLACWEV
jgi:hypothetical protein